MIVQKKPKIVVNLKKEGLYNLERKPKFEGLKSIRPKK